MTCDRFCSGCKDRNTCDKPLEAWVRYGDYDNQVNVVFNGWRNRNKIKYAVWKELRAVNPLFGDTFIEFARFAHVSISHYEPSVYGSYFCDMREEVRDGE